MSSDHFTDGYLTGTEYRMITAADTAAEGDWGPEDGYLKCPAAHPEPNPACEWCSGWAEAWT